MICTLWRPNLSKRFRHPMRGRTLTTKKPRLSPFRRHLLGTGPWSLPGRSGEALTSVLMSMSTPTSDRTQVPDWARGVTRVAVLTGAGISTGSGIPDYRGPDGVWTRDPSEAEVSTLDNYLGDAATRVRFWRRYVGHQVWRAEPNAAHLALVRLDKSPISLRVVTQNIDGLHQRSGIEPRKVLELHGSVLTTSCTRCRAGLPTEQVCARVAAGESDPHCEECGAILKVDTILFGEQLNPDVLSQAVSVASASQLLLAIGSSLQVEPAASLCWIAVEHGAHLVIVNRDPTPYDELADEVIRTDITEAVPTIVDLLVEQAASTGDGGAA